MLAILIANAIAENNFCKLMGKLHMSVQDVNRLIGLNLHSGKVWSHGLERMTLATPYAGKKFANIKV
jgi:hypothetical protein